MLECFDLAASFILQNSPSWWKECIWEQEVTLSESNAGKAT